MLLQLKLDLHVHSRYSPDSIITSKELAFYAKKRGLDGVAITDHDRVDGASRIARESGLFVIPGIEVSTAVGHVVGLNIQEPIPKGLSAEETVREIHEAGGIAVACHPTALLKGSLEKHVTSKFDAVEIINSSAIPFNYCTKRSRQLAASLGIRSYVAGSDAHYGPEIGYAYTVVNAEKNVGAVVKAINDGACQPFGKAIPLTLRLRRAILTTIKSRA
jgi:predicted metal-dependent phosphoesterase TrpH